MSRLKERPGCWLLVLFGGACGGGARFCSWTSSPAAVQYRLVFIYWVFDLLVSAPDSFRARSGLSLSRLTFTWKNINALVSHTAQPQKRLQVSSIYRHPAFFLTTLPPLAPSAALPYVCASPLLPCYFFSKDGTIILLGEGWAMLRPWLWWRDGYMECRLLLMSVFGWGGHAAAVEACCPAHRYFSGPLSFLLHYSTSSGRDYCRACNALFSEHTASVHMQIKVD